ncbi:hypothetical protein [Undibacterium sp. Ji22W]|uniref:hypothetical protein n=1 Tax=Undibacterium sp. Ji22W TaxID=3413038 RepID=UPI003BF3A4F9
MTANVQAEAIMGVTYRTRQKTYDAITAIIGTGSLTRQQILPELQKEYPNVTENALYQVLGTLTDNKVICIEGYDRTNPKYPQRIYKIRSKPPPPPKQTWITPLFVSITPL